jgi:uncharacterized delta-60 repeat protein
LDSTFGSSGKTLDNVSGLYDEATHIVQQSDAKLLVAGYSVTPIVYGFVSRYTSNGNVDQSFGFAGIASLSAGVNPLAISTLPGGDFLITSPGQLRRFTSDGQLVTSFGGGGIAETPIGSVGDVAYSAATQADGKVVFAGRCASPSGFVVCLARYDSGGRLDASGFGGGTGRVTLPFATDSLATFAVAEQVDRKLLVLASCDVSGQKVFCMARLNADGSLDTSTFGSGTGILNGTLSIKASARLVLQPDEKIIIEGACLVDTVSACSNLCVARYLNTGEADRSFNLSGNLITNFGSVRATADVALQRDGKLVVATRCAGPTDMDFCVARVNSDGAYDRTFGSGGTAIAQVGNGDDFFSKLILQSDGKIVAGGVCRTSTQNPVCLIRLEGGPYGYQNCTLDLDGDNRVLATTDALIAAGIALGLTGDSVVAGIFFPASATRKTWTDIRKYLVAQCGMPVTQ